MAFVNASLVLESSTTTGTGTLTLAGAVASHLTFSVGVGVDNTCAYSIEASNGQKETGIGTVGAGTLARTTLIASSTGALLNLPAGTHYVGVTANSASFSSAAIDTLAAATDITTLNVSTTAHGLAPKAVAPASGALNVLGIANGETTVSNKTIFEGLLKVVILPRATYDALGPGRPGTTLYVCT
jgi:hypothetical protein